MQSNVANRPSIVAEEQKPSDKPKLLYFPAQQPACGVCGQLLYRCSPAHSADGTRLFQCSNSDCAQFGKKMRIRASEAEEAT